jgi:hydroxymethylglutaryl-CoA lyase
MSEEIMICEVGPRDGLQMAKGRVPTATKIRWIKALAASGLKEIEVGSFVPARVIPQMADTAEVTAAAAEIEGLTVVALAPNLRGAISAFEAGADRVSVPVSVSNGHSRANLNRTPEDQVAEIGRIVLWAHSQQRPFLVEAACSTAFGCSIDGAVPLSKTLRLAESLAAVGADSITLADTVGYANPGQVKEAVRAVRASIGDLFGGLHLHDTMGMGLANAYAGLEEGVRSFDSSLAGLGGCPYAPGASGNIVTEDLVFMLESLGFTTGIDIGKLLVARAILREGLPDEAQRGGVAQAGVPKIFRHAA